MTGISRRTLLKGMAGAAVLGLFGCSGVALRGAAPRVVVIGGGFGGATAAKYLRMLDPGIEVSLVEPRPAYVTCPGSNWFLGGLRSIDSLTTGYDALASRHGVRIVPDRAVGLDPASRTVRLAGGSTLGYDRLIVAPGIDFRWEAIEGYGESVAETVPHAWQAGVQTIRLREQLAAMADGGVYLVAVPPAPFRCPPGPYERVSMVAHYFKEHKPKSKILLLDAQEKFSKQGLFEQGWKDLYGYGTDTSLIERIPGPEGKVTRYDAAARAAIAGSLGTSHRADVLNLIPPQRAGALASAFGLTDASGWCPVDHRSWESTLVPGVHVIGDASIAAPMPKSGFCAASQAKVCAAAVSSLLRDQPVPEPVWINACYSLLAPTYGISVAMVYGLSPEGKVMEIKGAGGVTPKTDPRSLFLEARSALHWYDAIRADSFG